MNAIMLSDEVLLLVSVQPRNLYTGVTGDLIAILVQIPEAAIGCALEGREFIRRDMMARHLADDAANTAMALKGIKIDLPLVSDILLKRLSLETWAAPPRPSDYTNIKNHISAWIVQPGDPYYA